MQRRRRFKLAAIGLSVLCGLWLVLSAGVTWKLTRRSVPPFVESAAELRWAKVEERRLKTADGQQIGAWLVRGAPEKGCVLLLHGNGGCRTTMQNVAQMLVTEGVTVMAISVRAHGDSTGEINDFGYGARRDVVAAVQVLETEFPGRPIFIVGRSLGSAAALFAADELGDRVAGYLLEQPYKDLDSATWNRLQNHLPPVADWVAYGGMRCCAASLLPVDLAVVAPGDHLLSIPKEVPITIATGSADRHALLKEVQEMYGRVSDHARLIVFEGAEHVDLDLYDPDLYRQMLLEFVKVEAASRRFRKKIDLEDSSTKRRL